MGNEFLNLHRDILAEYNDVLGLSAGQWPGVDTFEEFMHVDYMSYIASP